jgi:hypothetical protein
MFSTLSQKHHDFQKKKFIESKMCGLNGLWKVMENGTVNTLVLLSMCAQTSNFWD